MNILNSKNDISETKGTSISPSIRPLKEREGAKILIIEDEPHIASGIAFNLEQEGISTMVASSGVEAIKIWKTFSPHLVLLDLMLPDCQGLELLDYFRKENEKIPILILSAKGQLSDKVQGLSRGADDYLTKPFHLEELFLRINRLLKHSKWYQGDPSLQNPDSPEIASYQFGDNLILLDQCLAKTPSGEFRLTEQEMKLLKLFFSSPEKVISKKVLLKEGWGYHQDSESRTLDIFITRLRKYFEKESKDPKHFVSVRNQGIIFYPFPKT